MAGSVAGQTALVAGAGRGIGRALAEALAAEGAAVGLLARSVTEIDAVAKTIRDRGGSAVAIATDVTFNTDVLTAVERCESALGPITFLVSNAGVPGPFGPIGSVNVESWWQAQNVHLKAPLLLASAVLPGMRQRRRGRILCINSIGGVIVQNNTSAYCAGKAAQLRLVEHIDSENRSLGIRAFALQPGIIITAMARETMARADAQRWAPEMISALKALEASPQATADLDRCTAACLAIASGRYDALAGRYLDAKDDLDALSRTAESRPPQEARRH